MWDWTPSATPDLYPLGLSPDQRRAYMVRLTETDYAGASFLDGRLLERGPEAEWVDAAALFTGGAAVQRRTHFIFHTGHVGSTLLSRLLGEHPQLFSVREPALLREVAAGPLRARLDVLLALFSRTWRPDQTALIKATSFVSQIAPALMDRASGGRAILLSTTPPVYLRTILAGEASRQEARLLEAARRDRLAARLGRAVAVDGEGERIAAAWLCEACALHGLMVAQPERCLWLDFDRLLAEPEAALRLALGHLQLEADAIDIAAILHGPIMRRYAKAPEHAYDADLRRQVLGQAGRDMGGEVRRGMDWLQRQVRLSPDLADVLRAAAAAARASLAAAAPPL